MLSLPVKVADARGGAKESKGAWWIGLWCAGPARFACRLPTSPRAIASSKVIVGTFPENRVSGPKRSFGPDTLFSAIYLCSPRKTRLPCMAAPLETIFVFWDKISRYVEDNPRHRPKRAEAHHPPLGGAGSGPGAGRGAFAAPARPARGGHDLRRDPAPGALRQPRRAAHAERAHRAGQTGGGPSQRPVRARGRPGGAAGDAHAGRPGR